jgi:hypothetical protein
MVKNTTGGSKHKSFSRKDHNHNNHLLLPSNPLELFAIVHKFIGNSTCLVSSKHLSLICHIRNKFKGKFKKQNFISVGTFLLVGLREWESTPKNCDVIAVYDHSDLAILKTNPAFTFSDELIYSLTHTRGSSYKDNDLVTFDENAEEEDHEDSLTNMIVSEREEEIDIEDI